MWRVLYTGQRPQHENIAFDQIMLELRAQDKIPNTIRFLQFKPECVLIGYHQSVEQEVRLEYVQREGIEVGRRITGGGAIYFDETQIGWEIIADKNSFGENISFEELTAKICNAVAKGLQKLGIPAQFRPRNDIEVEGRKISGTGGVFEGKAFLYQGTILMDFNVERMLKSLQIPVEKLTSKGIKSAEDRVEWVKRYLGRMPEKEEVFSAILEGLSEELTVEVKEWVLLAKSLHPLPEKWHGLKDVEVRYRQRYLDLIANEHARRVFFLRNRLISEIRRFLDAKGFLEVETPILQPIASGANAKPFITYHNYLEQNLYLRIAPELYLKRLIVGGINRVYELGKNFRNEGVDTTHNPEFTMLEFYCAYWDYKDLMVFTEELFSYLLNQLVGGLKITYQGKELDFTPPFKRYRYFELLEEKTGKDKDFFLRDVEGLRKLAKEIGVPKAETLTHAKLIDKVFDLLVEDELWGPCFVIDFPKLLSPLAKTHREDPDLVERFELFVAGKEIANAYTELNDPMEQRERFLEQLKEKEMGDEEAMAMDEDFIRALEYGMPPTAGEGIGIDRLVMLLADVDSIREVILFPALRQKT